MPELPEVQSIVNALLPHLPSRTISSVSQSRLDIASHSAFRRSGPGLDLAPLLTSRTITSLHRRAKRIILTLDNHAHLYFHLGMTGRLTLSPPPPPKPPATHPPLPGSPLSSLPPPLSLPHTHLTLSLTPPALTSSFSLHPSSLLLSFSDPRRFGHIVYLPPSDNPTDDPGGGDLGPEPLTLSPADFHALLRSTRRPLKPALLDQRLLAGLGNIYVDESLHAAHLHPRKLTYTLSLPQATLLLSHIKRILLASIAASGSTLRDYRTPDNAPGSFQSSHQVYNRTAKPCPICQTPIQKITLAQRSTHFCPTCQPPPHRRRRAAP